MEALEDFVDRRYLAAALVLFLALAIGVASQFTGLGNTQEDFSSPARQELKSSSSLGYSADAPSGAESDGASGSSTERKRITRYNIDLEVPDVEEAMNGVQQFTEEYAGIVDSSSFSRETDTRGTLAVRVPEENVTAFLDALEQNWEVKSSQKNSDDVTDRYTEIELELRNRRQELRQLEKLINRTNDTSDLIEIQDRMSHLRSRIQYLENQLTGLDRRIEYTEVTVNFEEPESLTTEFDLRESFMNAYRAIFSSLNLIIVGLGYLLPFLVIGAIIYKGRNIARQL